MSIECLISELNALPHVLINEASRGRAYELISALSDLFLHSDVEQRRLVTANLNRSARYVMAEYSRGKAVEGWRTRSRTNILQGLIPVVMAGGNTHTRTGGMLLALLLHAAEKAGLDAEELFAYAARFVVDDTEATRLRDFPLPENRSEIESFGFHELRTPEGMTFEHQVEAATRPRWWDRFLRRRRVTRAEVYRTLGEIERDAMQERRGPK